MSLDIKTKKANLETAVDALYNQAAAVTANSAASDVLNLLRGVNEAERLVDEIKFMLGPEDENAEDNPSSDNVPEDDSAKVEPSNQDNANPDDTAKDPEANADAANPADAQPTTETTTIDGTQ